MPRKEASEKDDEFEIEEAPKRHVYKKIRLEVKQRLIADHEAGELIPELSRRYHLSYSTIAHILKTYQEKKVIFESKRSRIEREVEEDLKRETQPQTPTMSPVEAAPQSFYPFVNYPAYLIYLPL